MSENNFSGWSKAIKDMEMSKREPMWDLAIKHLVAEGAMEPTVYDTLTQGQIQEIALAEQPSDDIQDVFLDMAKWMTEGFGEIRFYVSGFLNGNELWLAYLMAVYYAMEWDGRNWVSIG